MWFYLQVFVVCPSTVQFEHPHFSMVTQFSPHLTMEDPPNLSALFNPSLLARHCRNKEHRYQDPAQKLGECKVDQKTSWGDNLFMLWVKSEMSLDLFQYRTSGDFH